MKEQPATADVIVPREPPWLGLDCVTTCVTAPDVRGAAGFYANAMGMVPMTERVRGDGVLLQANMRHRGSKFTVIHENWAPGASGHSRSAQSQPFIFLLYVADVRMLVTQMVSAGSSVLIGPQVTLRGVLTVRVKDPVGYQWDVAQQL